MVRGSCAHGDPPQSQSGQNTDSGRLREKRECTEMMPEHQRLATEIEAAFRHCLATFAEVPASLDYLHGTGTAQQAEDFIHLNAAAARSLLDGSSQIAPINDPSFLHFLWLLGVNSALQNLYLDVLLNPTVSGHFSHTPFWKRYVHSLGCFMRAVPFDGKETKAKGYEKFWLPYLDFMVGRTSLEEFRLAAAESFEKRNRQARSIDWRSLDGDQKQPVKWDFRWHSIIIRAA